MKRGGGVLMHIASLPGPFGIGVFGEEAVTFAKQLHNQGMKYWQVLPFSYPGMGNSPYQSFSAFAGNWLFIDPRMLMKMGLLTSDEVVGFEYKENKWRINYDFLRGDRERMLKLAYTRANDELKDKVRAFAKENKWADDVALYLAIKLNNYRQAWWQWQDEGLRNYKEESLKKVRVTDDYLYQVFVQYLFSINWADIKSRINAEGIEIIGDMPIYVAQDSSDVWAAREFFKMAPEGTTDKNGNPIIFSKAAGVPPDYFSEDGQLWGNPIYDWPKHKADGYKWWMNRIAENLKLYDYVRIDHFRAFSSYWEVESTAKTARVGEWVPGPGMDFFKVFNKKFGDSSRLIAEDLGEKTPDLEAFMEECGLPGMRVMEFGFNPGEDSSYLPHNYDENCVAYTGTHDNNTLLGWLWEAQPWERDECLKYCGFTGDNWGEGGTRSASCRAVIKTLWMSHANTVIIPIQDMLGYGADTRMNTPGTVNGNWDKRFSNEDLSSIDNDWYKELNRLYRR